MTRIDESSGTSRSYPTDTVRFLLNLPFEFIVSDLYSPAIILGSRQLAAGADRALA